VYRLIVNTPASGLNFLGVGGVPVINAHRQIRAVLEHKFGEAVANLLGEPKRASSTGPIDWYTNCPGIICKLTNAPQEIQNSKRKELNNTIAKIREYADSLPDRQLATRLKSAVTFPSDEFVYLVGDDLVIVCWGATTEFPDAEKQELIKQLNATVARQPVVAHEAVAAAPQEEPPPLPADDQTSNREANVSRSEIPIQRPQRPSRPIDLRPLAILALVALLFAVSWALISNLSNSCGIRPLPFISGHYFGWCPEQAISDLRHETTDLEKKLETLKGKVVEAPNCEQTPQVLAKKKQEIEERERQEAEKKRAAEQERLKQEKAREQVEIEKRQQQAAEEARRQQEAQAKEIERRKKELKAKEGEITITLGWQSYEDLDVILSCPNGDEISYKHREACGGKLDIDMNYQGVNSNSPIENIFVPARSIMPGAYQIKVVNQSDVPTPFLLIIKYREHERRESGVVNGKSFIQYPLN
jgi:hypothetical protein